MAKVTKASCALKAVVKPQRVMTQKQLSEALDCTQQAVSAWLNGVSQPDTERRQKIEAMFQIPVADWAEVVPPPAADSSGAVDTDEDEAEATGAVNDDAKSNGTEG